MTSPEDPSVSGTWIFPTGQDLGLFLTTIGAGVSLAGLGTVGAVTALPPLGNLLTAGVVAGGFVLTDRGIRLWRHGAPPKMEHDMFGDMDMGMDPYGAPQTMFIGGELHPDVSRVVQVAEASFGDRLFPFWEEFEIIDGALMKYAFKSSTPGYFTSKSTQSQVIDKLVGAVPATKGAWNSSVKSKDDMVVISQQSSIPKLALPPEWKVVKTAAEAGVAYRKFSVALGPGESGKMVTFKPQVFPHCAVIATSGGGKSVFLRACIEQFRAVGGQVILGDGKGSDYSTLRNQPGVVAIGRGSGSKGVEYIAAIEMAFRIMQQRQNTAAERKTANPDTWEDVPPVFLVLDELKSVLKKWSTELDKKSFKAIESKVNQILALGRQLRVHVYTASQDVYQESIPPSWLTNIGMKISLGKPHHLTINKGFDEQIRTDATRIAAGIDPNVRGRGMIAGMDEDTGTATVRPYQGFLGYSPGEARPGFFNDEQKAQWDSFRKNVSEAIPELYGRKWFQIEGASEAQLAKEKETGVDFGYIDFELFTVDEIANMKIINLDMRDAEGNIVSNPELVQFDPDPNNAEYVCKPVVNESNTITDI